MSDKDTIHALQRHLADAEVERMKHVERIRELVNRVEALEVSGVESLKRLCEVSNYLGPFDHKLMFDSLTETINAAKAVLPPQPRPSGALDRQGR